MVEGEVAAGGGLFGGIVCRGVGLRFWGVGFVLFLLCFCLRQAYRQLTSIDVVRFDRRKIHELFDVRVKREGG